MNDAIERAKANFREGLEEPPPPTEETKQRKPLALRPMYWVVQVIILAFCFLLMWELKADPGNLIKRWATLIAFMVLLGMAINFLRLIWILVSKKQS